MVDVGGDAGPGIGFAARGFDRPNTITSPAGMGMGIIFTAPVTL